MSINNKNKLKENNKKYNLDTTHCSIANKIETDENNTIPNLEKEIEELKFSIHQKITIDKKLDIIDKIKDLKKEIKSLKKIKKDYYF